MSELAFEPRIIGFLCNWCSYSAADTAGIARVAQPSNVDIVRVMCTGRVEPRLILKALSMGADGVLVGLAIQLVFYIEPVAGDSGIPPYEHDML